MTPGDLTIGINTVVGGNCGCPGDVYAGRVRVSRGRHDADEERRSRAAKNVLTFCAVLARVTGRSGFGIAFGNATGLIGTSGYAPDASALMSVGKAPFSFFGGIPGGAGYLFEVVFAGVSVAIVWGGMAERAKLWVYFAFGAAFTIIYSVVSHWVVADRRLAVQAGHAGLCRLDRRALPGGARGAGPVRCCSAPHRPVRTERSVNAIAGHNLPYAVLGTIILWFGWFGFNPGSTLGIVSGDRVGFFAYVATTTNLAAAAGGLSGILVSWAFRSPQARPVDAAERRVGRPGRDHRGLRLRRAVGKRC
jgi:Amt family ammonium transporter